MGNTVPSQIRSVDPYASYNSDVVNKLTRIITDGRNILLTPSPIDVSIIDTTHIRALAGKAVMQDVLIEIQNLDVDVTDIDFYVDSSGGVWNEEGYYLVVLYYEYNKTSPAPVAEIKIILPSQKATVYDPTKHLFLKCMNVIDNGGTLEVDSLLDYDFDNPMVEREFSGAGSGGNFVATDDNTIGLGKGSSDPTESSIIYKRVDRNK